MTERSSRVGSARSRELRLTVAEVAEATGGSLLHGDPGSSIGGFSIDSRRLAAGDTFFAIRGPNFDGHAFVSAVVDAGAAGVVVDREAPTPNRGFVIVVDDTIRALQALGRFIRRRSGAKVVAVTGSAGKTTTKETTAAMLGTRYRVLRNLGNLNNHIGLPLSLLELRHGPDIAVVELGMNHAGELRTLVGIAEPDVRVWTNVAEVHTEFFESLDAVADAKAEILEQSAKDTVLVANADDPLVVARTGGFPGRVIRFGLTGGAEVTARNLEERGLDGFDAVLHTPAGEAPVRIPLLGRANVMNVLAAASVAVNFEVPLDSIVAQVATLKPATHRGEVLRLAGGITLVDDCYNSNPRALRGVLEVVGRETRTARRIAVLGEMLELGAQSRALHEMCGRVAAAANLRYLVTVGGDSARALGESAIAAGMQRSAVVHLGTSAEAADMVRNLVRPGDLVLVKGSRGIRTEFVVDRLKAEFA